mmetsp:Transcript_39313/g.81606  ORF Transcript_39313/g.81606 Transcript_39313/m.81606 type:complete len:218 (+) Transcript_39313:2541-3194(+)
MDVPNVRKVRRAFALRTAGVVVVPIPDVTRARGTSSFVPRTGVASDVNFPADVPNRLWEDPICVPPMAGVAVVPFRAVANPRNPPHAFVSSTVGARNVLMAVVKRWPAVGPIIVRRMVAEYDANWMVAIVWPLGNCNCVEPMGVVRHVAVVVVENKHRRHCNNNSKWPLLPVVKGIPWQPPPLPLRQDIKPRPRLRKLPIWRSWRTCLVCQRPYSTA